MEKAPKKNISLVISDVKHPQKKLIYKTANLCQQTFPLENYLGDNPHKILVRAISRRPENWQISIKKRRFVSFSRIISAVLGVIALSAVISGSLIFSQLNNAKTIVSEEIDSIVNNSQQAIESLNNFEPQIAAIFFDKNNYELIAAKNFLENFHLINILNLGEFFSELLNSNQSALVISQNLEILKTKGLSLFLKSDGQELIQVVKNLQKEIGNLHRNMNLVRNQITSISNKMAFIKGSFFIGFNQINQTFTDKYLNYSPKLYQLEDILASLLNILQSKNDVHWLLFFQNPAEIRPAGGFLGSYADLTVSSGRLANIDVRDIYDPDGQLDLKVIPPLPLQTITTAWGARDANWFFDFPTSAQKVTGFLETSKIYQEKNIQFSGAIALNIRVLESILDITGPIELSDYKFEINKNNFMKEIQKEVEAGPDKSRGEPKHILKVLTPILLEKINSFNDEQKKTLIEKFKFHLSQKNIMFFTKDQNLQNFFSQNDFDGAVYKLASNFWGSYLAVVNANVAGGKSDFFVKQEINLTISLDSNGRAASQLDIKRTHYGNTEKDYWWRATNKDYIKIFASPESNLLNISGNSQKTIKPPTDYQKGNYQADPEIKTTENAQQFSENFNTWSGQEFGKTVWATWFNLPAGQTKTLKLKYETPANISSFLKPGQIYQFIFDKQSGVDAKLKMAIEAPPGYKWRESQHYIYEYQNDNPPGRLIINLTLSKI